MNVADELALIGRRSSCSRRSFSVGGGRGSRDLAGQRGARELDLGGDPQLGVALHLRGLRLGGGEDALLVGLGVGAHAVDELLDLGVGGLEALLVLGELVRGLLAQLGGLVERGLDLIVALLRRACARAGRPYFHARRHEEQREVEQHEDERRRHRLLLVDHDRLAVRVERRHLAVAELRRRTRPCP